MKGLPQRKGKLNVNTSEEYAVVKSFGSKSITTKYLFFLLKDLEIRNVTFNFNLKYKFRSSATFQICSYYL